MVDARIGSVGRGSHETISFLLWRSWEVRGKFPCEELNAKSPNEKWIIDVKEFSMFGKKLYSSLILDLYNR